MTKTALPKFSYSKWYGAQQKFNASDEFYVPLFITLVQKKSRLLQRRTVLQRVLCIQIVCQTTIETI